MHFAFALPSDLERVPYLDMTIEMDGATPRGVFFGELVALTDAGVLIELSYRGEDEIGPVRFRPLRGRVADIALAYDERAVERGRLPQGSVTITLDNDDPAISLPLTARNYGADFLGSVVSALTTR